MWAGYAIALFFVVIAIAHEWGGGVRQVLHMAKDEVEGFFRKL